MSENLEKLIELWNAVSADERRQFTHLIKKENAITISLCEAAKSLRVSPANLRKMVELNKIPVAEKSPKGSYRFNKSDVEKLNLTLINEKREKMESRFSVYDLIGYPDFNYIKFLYDLWGSDDVLTQNDCFLISAQIDNLPHKEKVILSLYYRSLTYRDIATMYDLSRSYIHNIVRRGMRILRHPSRIGRNLECLRMPKYSSPSTAPPQTEEES